jgi:RNAPII transcription regulator C-terminal
LASQSPDHFRDIGILCRANSNWAADVVKRLGAEVVTDISKGQLGKLSLLVTVIEMTLGSRADGDEPARLPIDMFQSCVGISLSLVDQLSSPAVDGAASAEFSEVLERFYASFIAGAPSADDASDVSVTLLSKCLPSVRDLLASDNSTVSLGKVRVSAAILASCPPLGGHHQDFDDSQMLPLLLDAALSDRESTSLMTKTWARNHASVHCCAVAFAVRLNRLDAAQSNDIVALFRERALLSSTTETRALGLMEGLMGWTLRSLVVRGHAEATSVFAASLQAITARLGGSQRRGDAAEIAARMVELASCSPEMLGADGVPLMTRASGGQVANFFLQRLLCKLIPVLAERARAPAPDGFVPVVALAALVVSCPPAAVTGEIERVLPLCIQGLEDCPATAQQAQATLLRAAALLLAVAPAGTLQNVESTAPRIANAVAQAAEQEDTVTAARLAAVRVLLLLSRFAHHALHTAKPRVLDALQAALDDDRRVVRRDAARARNAWLMAN